MKKKLLIGLVAGLVSFNASADVELTKKMQEKFKQTPVTNASFVDGIPGLIELVVDKNKILYTSQAGDKVLVGHIYDTATNRDLTQEKINSLSKINFKDLPFNQSITITKGAGGREFAIFTDIDCPYCKKLEQEIAKLDNVKVHVFMFPLAMHPEALSKSVAIWCSKDKAQAYQAYMLNGVQPAPALSCASTGESIIKSNIRFGSENGMSGTPALIGKNGVVMPGYLPADRLNAWLDINGK